MDVSIIIVNYNTSHLISDCLESIRRLTKDILYEVIIVDNNSEPDLAEKISQTVSFELSQDFHFILLPENIGFGRANNEGLKIAKGRNIFFLNPDTVLLNNAVKILSDFLDTHPKAGVCAGNLYDVDLNPTFSFWQLYPGIGETMDALSKYKLSRLVFGRNVNYNYSDKPIKVGYVIGADLMAPKLILDKTGGFSDEFFMFSEETDLCKRVRKSGKFIYNVPEAKIIHLESGSFEKNEFPSEKRTHLIEESRKKYFKLHHSALYISMENLLYSLFLQSRVWFLKNPAKKIYFKNRLKYFKKK